MDFKLTPRKALENLDQASKIINATREQHAILSESVKVLEEYMVIREKKEIK